MTWDNIIYELDSKLKSLTDCDSINRMEINKKISFDRGIYVFYEDSKPLYVGRSNTIKSRLQQHSRQSSSSNQASFAFILAKEEFLKNENMSLEKMTRDVLEKHPEFKELFKSQKKRVSNMNIKFVSIENANFQTIFEVYAHMKLETPYNTFENH
jgi:predicted GIY-YIG superfamily endonuclease